MSSRIDVRSYNREAWNRQVAGGNHWTKPVTPEVIAAARRGEWSVVLTDAKSVPRGWFPDDLHGIEILCLASGGGQQGPVLAAAGARVTVFDNSPMQLAQDRLVAEREGLELKTIEGDMRDLSAFPDSSFDLIFHPVSNIFVPDALPVWRECHRVLEPGGSLLAGINNPWFYLFDLEQFEKGELQVTNRLPYSDLDSLSAGQMRRYDEQGIPLEFSHTLDEQIGGQIEAGFVIAGFYEDALDHPGYAPLSKYTNIFIATRAIKVKI